MCLVTVKQENDFIDETQTEIKKEIDEEPTLVIVKETEKEQVVRTPDPEVIRKKKSGRISSRNASTKSSHVFEELIEVKCDVWDESFSMQNDLEFDDSNVSEENSNENADHSEAEKKILTNVSSLTCSLCRKKVELKDSDDTQIHMDLVHKDPKNPFAGPYKCEKYGKTKYCTKIFPSELRIRKHIRQFHLFKNEKLCTTCGKTFYDRRAFFCHIDKNHGIRVSDNEQNHERTG